MFTKHFNQTVLSIDFAGFRKQDEEFFERFCHLWFKMSNNACITIKESEHHLISTLISLVKIEIFNFYGWFSALFLSFTLSERIDCASLIIL